MDTNASERDLEPCKEQKAKQEQNVNANNRNKEKDVGFFSLFNWKTMLNVLGAYFVMKAMFKTKTSNNTNGSNHLNATLSNTTNQSNELQYCSFADSAKYDIYVYLTNSSSFDLYNEVSIEKQKHLIWTLKNLEYSDFFNPSSEIDMNKVSTNEVNNIAKDGHLLPKQTMDTIQTNEMSLNISLTPELLNYDMTYSEYSHLKGEQSIKNKPNLYMHVFMSSRDYYSEYIQYVQSIIEKSHKLSNAESDSNPVAQPVIPGYNSRYMAYRIFPLIKYKKKKEAPKLVQLGGRGGKQYGIGSQGEDLKIQNSSDIVSSTAAKINPNITYPFLKPIVRIAVVTGFPSPIAMNTLPTPLLQNIRFLSEEEKRPLPRLKNLKRDSTRNHMKEFEQLNMKKVKKSKNKHSKGIFQPVLYQNDFWLTSKQLISINSTLMKKNSTHEEKCEIEQSDAGPVDPVSQWDVDFCSKSSEDSTSTLPQAQVEIKLIFEHISFWKWNLFSSLETQWSGGGITGSLVTATTDALSAHINSTTNSTNNSGITDPTAMLTQWLDTANEASIASTERESDLIKEILFDTDPWLLAVTGVVSLLHSVFDFLAFKNDIQFWRKRKSMQGTSLRTLLINAFFHTIIFLYLYDSSEKTSIMVLISNFIGLIIEYWKLQRAFHFRLYIDTNYLWFVRLTWNLEIEDESIGPALEAEKQTHVVSIEDTIKINKIEDASCPDVYNTDYHDMVATTHLLYVITPMVVGYTVYSYYYMLHKSYYSWIISSLVGFVYAFGFILMTPQIYINYKLKSVAHMPWKAMVYKSINTFIDDLFAFVIKMPTLHRISCLRDDLIFFIYLYQKWIYPVDYNRVNEYGQCVDDEIPAVKKCKELPSISSEESKHEEE